MSRKQFLGIYMLSTIDYQEAISMDILYVGLTVVLFGLSWGLVKLCERL